MTASVKYKRIKDGQAVPLTDKILSMGQTVIDVLENVAKVSTWEADFTKRNFVVNAEVRLPIIMPSNGLKNLLNNAKDANLKGNVAQVMFTEVRGSNVELVVAYKCSKESIE